MFSGVLLPIQVQKPKENPSDEKPALPPRDRDLNAGNFCTLPLRYNKAHPPMDKNKCFACDYAKRAKLDFYFLLVLLNLLSPVLSMSEGLRKKSNIP